MKRKRDSQEEESNGAMSSGKAEIKEKRRKKKSEAALENSTEIANDTVSSSGKELQSEQGSSGNDQVESSSGKQKKPRENDPHRLWKRDRVHPEYTQLQDERGRRKAKGNGAAELSLEYLRQWKNDKKSWSFRKVRQVWLLQHLYDKQKIGKSDFKLLLAYLDGLKGTARTTTLELARKIVEGEEDEEEDVDPEEANRENESKAAGEGEEKDVPSSDAAEGDAAAAVEGGDDVTGVDAEEARARAEEARARAEAEREQRAAERAQRKRIREKRATQVLRELS